jgi:RimJ/RimL family protein N-acetyltransferase
MSQPAILTDGDLRLRPAVLPDDVALGVPWYHDPEVLYFSEGEGVEPYDHASVERMYRYLAGKGELYIIEVMTPAGWLPVGDATLTPETLPIALGHPAYRSRGLGRRVLSLLIRRARDLGWAALRTKGIYGYNERSRRLYEGAGFRVMQVLVDDEGRETYSHELVL